MSRSKTEDESGQRAIAITRYVLSGSSNTIDVRTLHDTVAVESPLEIRIVFGDGEKRKDRSLSITMRTPGDDESLAAGFLLSEGIINSADEIEGFETCGTIPAGESISNQLRVNLAAGYAVDISRFQRHFYTTSSCGVCGKASLDAVEAQNVKEILDDGVTVDPQIVLKMPNLLQAKQSIFGNTGGIHAAALMKNDAQVLGIAEDVGRHNAVDKLIGRCLIQRQSPSLKQSVLAVSGRASFELVQKAVVAQIPVMVAVGAPSSLAIDLANRFGLTLIGFNSGQKFNVYSHPDRVVRN